MSGMAPMILRLIRLTAGLHTSHGTGYLTSDVRYSFAICAAYEAELVVFVGGNLVHAGNFMQH